jgi:methylated-DNA-[protein]-cysteine S-methyltransferase
LWAWKSHHWPNKKGERIDGVIQMAVIDSPVGRLTLAARDARLVALRFGNEETALRDQLRGRDGNARIAAAADPAGAVSALQAYFGGDLRALDDLTVEMLGTPFQQRVWSALRTIGAGRTASYSDIAREIGMPTAVRAVGAANGANPIAIVVPCHRVIGTTGSLVGYGGGLERKRWLLEHEGVLLKM